MTPQEREMLVQFLQQLNSTQAGQKDPDAELLIRQSMQLQPDAGYLLVQRAMGLDMALQVSQAQVEKLQAQLDKASPAAAGGFLNTANEWGRKPATANPAQAVAPPVMTPVMPAASPLAAPPAAPARAPSAWGSGMMGTIATTAVGVVAGSMLYQGIQGMMGHHGNDAGAAGTAAGAHPDKLHADAQSGQHAAESDPAAAAQTHAYAPDDADQLASNAYPDGADDSGGSDDSDFS